MLVCTTFLLNKKGELILFNKAFSIIIIIFYAKAQHQLWKR